MLPLAQALKSPRPRAAAFVVVVLVFGLAMALPSAARAADLKDARQALGEKNYPRVVEILDTYLAEHPSDQRALAMRGRAYVELHLPDKALADLNRAIEIQPAKNGQDVLSRGRAYLALGDFDKALADLNKAIELAPDQAERYYCRGHARSDKQDHEAAFRDFHRAIELDPRYAAAYIARGYTQWRRGTKSRPVVYHQGENTFQVMQFESVVDRELVDQGLADLDRAIELAPEDPIAYQMQADFSRELKEWPRYLAAMNNLVRLNPEASQARNDLAWFLSTIDVEGLRDGKRAVELAEKNCALTKYENPVVLGTLAAALAESGKYKRAVETQEKAIARLGEAPPEIKQDFEKRLEQFRRKMPLRFADPCARDGQPSSPAASHPLGARKRKREADLTDVEHALVRAINAARRERDLKPLTIQPALVGPCRDHARTMLARGEARDAFDGQQPGDRITGAGITPRHWGITAGRGASVGALVDEWKNSPIAAANILNADVNQLGIGTAVDAEGNIYASGAYVEIR